MKIKEAVLEPAMSHLIHLCQQELGISELPHIQLIDKPFIQSGEKKSFGEFNGNSIKVVTQGRHPMDVFRTLSHELTHWKQRLDGQEMDGSDGSDTENEANSTAGVIMRRFAEKYPDCFMSSIPD
jgi:hypothetical protein